MDMLTSTVQQKQKIKVGVVIDYGNTLSRFRIDLEDRVFLGVLSNEFAVIPDGYQVHQRYQNVRSSIFEYKGVRYANGAIVAREFKDKEIRPTKGSKVGQITTELTTHLVLLRLYTILSTILSVPMSSLDIVVDFTVLLPPKQQEFQADKMRELLKSFNKVTQIFPQEVVFEFTHGSEPIVESEAVAAFFGAVFKDASMTLESGSIEQLESKGILVFKCNSKLEHKIVGIPENRFAMKGLCLLLDVGGGSSDLAIIEDGELVENSKETFDIGGRYVSSQLMRVLSAKYFTPKNIDQVVATGLLEEGSTFHDVSAELTEAKREFASVMLTRIRAYLETQSIDLRTFRGLLVVGGGSLASQAVKGVVNGAEILFIPTSDLIPEGVQLTPVETSPPMTTILEESLREAAPNIKSLYVPDGHQRILNIQGAGLIHRSEHFK